MTKESPFKRIHDQHMAIQFLQLACFLLLSTLLFTCSDVRARELDLADKSFLDTVVASIMAHALPEVDGPKMANWNKQINDHFNVLADADLLETKVSAYQYLLEELEKKKSGSPLPSPLQLKHLQTMTDFFEMEQMVVIESGSEDLPDEDDLDGGNGSKNKKPKPGDKDKNGPQKVLAYPEIALKFGENAAPDKIYFADPNSRESIGLGTVSPELAKPGSSFLNLIHFSINVLGAVKQYEHESSQKDQKNQEAANPNYDRARQRFGLAIEGLDGIKTADHLLELYWNLTSSPYKNMNGGAVDELAPLAVENLKAKESGGTEEIELSSAQRPMAYYADKAAMTKAKISAPGDVGKIKTHVLKGMTTLLLDQRIKMTNSLSSSNEVHQHFEEFSAKNCLDNCPGIADVEIGSLFLEMAKIKNGVMLEDSTSGRKVSFSQDKEEGKNLCVLEKFYRTCNMAAMVQKIEKFREDNDYGGCNEELSIQVRREKLETGRSDERSKRWTQIAKAMEQGKPPGGTKEELLQALELVRKEKEQEDEELKEDRRLRTLERVMVLKQLIEAEGVEKFASLLKDDEDANKLKTILKDMDLASIETNEEAMRIIKRNYYTLNKIVEDIEENQIKGLDLEKKSDKAEIKGGLEVLARRSETNARALAREARWERIEEEERKIIGIIRSVPENADLASGLKSAALEDMKKRQEKFATMEAAKKADEQQVESALGGTAGVKKLVRRSYFKNGKKPAVTKDTEEEKEEDDEDEAELEAPL